MSVDSLDIANLKKAIHDLKDYTKENNKELNNNTAAINMCNLLKMVELGMLSKDEVMGSSFYNNYKDNFILSSKQKKKSLF